MSEKNQLLDPILEQIMEQLTKKAWELDSVEIQKGTVSRTDPENPQYVQHLHSGDITVTLRITDPGQDIRARQFLTGDPSIS